MKKLNLVALPCLCVDVFDKTEIIRAGGEALNFAAHAAKYDDISVTLLGVVGKDNYAQAIMSSIDGMKINTEHIRIDESCPTANNRVYLTNDGDRYYKEDSWNGRILDNILLNDTEKELIASADVVFIHYYASCFEQVVELKKAHDFKLAVDFDVIRDKEIMKRYAPYTDFFMISGCEELFEFFEELSELYDGLFNITLAENGSVTYCKGKKYCVPAIKADEVVDTTGCGDSYHAGLVCSYMLHNDILKAMSDGSLLAAKTLSHFGGF